MTHPFDQLEKFCETHGCKKVIAKHRKGKQVSIAFVCPKCVAEDLTGLAQELEQIFVAWFGGRPVMAIAFTLPPDYNEVHWVTNVSREKGVELFAATAEKMKERPGEGD